MEIALGAPVVAGDGEELGTVLAFLVDPRTNVLSHFILAGKDTSTRSKAVPIWAIARAEAGEVLLEADSAEVARLPDFVAGERRPEAAAQAAPAILHEPGDFPTLFPEDGSLPPVSVVLAGDVVVACHEEAAGELSGVEADDYTAEVVTLFVQLDAPEAKQVAVPMAWARALARQRITLACRPDDLRSLPASPLAPSEEA